MAENTGNTFEFTGKTVDEAVAEGLAKLKVQRSDVAVEVLSKGSRGIFGIGSEPARVRIIVESESDSEKSASESGKNHAPEVQPAPTQSAVVELGGPDQAGPAADAAVDSAGAAEDEKPSPDEDTDVEADEDRARSTDLTDTELAEIASEMLSEIVRLMGYEANVVASWEVQDDNGGSPFLMLDVEGEDLGALIGRRGETLASLQYIVRLMVNQRIKEWRNIVVDVEKYKERREAQLTQLALRMADQVVDSGRAMALEPMPPNERRIVHIALRDHPDVYTQSSGEDDRRKVNIVPKDTA